MPKIRVTLDPGHGKNYNKGAVDGYYESNAMYDLAHYLGDALTKTGIFEVTYTKTKLDECPSLTARGKTAWSSGARFLFSLHSNGYNGSACGVTSYISIKRDSKKFANALNEAVVGQFQAFGDTGSYNRGPATKVSSSTGNDYYGLIRNGVLQPSCEHVILMEHGFHDNVKDCTCLANTAFLEAVAKAEAEVIYNELSQYYVDDSVKTYSATTTAALNVRSGPSSNDILLGTFTKGATVSVISIDDNWARVIWNGAIAFVNKNYLNLPSKTSIPVYSKVKNPLPNEEVVEDPTSVITNTDTITPYGTGIVTASALNVRSGPGTKYTSYGCISNGTELTVYLDDVCSGTGWYRTGSMTIGNTTVPYGYVSGDYVSVYGIDNACLATVNASALNVRSGPGKSYTKISSLANGTQVYVIPDSVDDGWTRILTVDDYNSYKNGTLSTLPVMYVSEDYLIMSATNVLAGTAEAARLTLKMPFGVGKTTAALNVRSGPGTSYSKITALSSGSCVILNAHLANGWAEIIYKGQLEYVCEDYIKVINDIGSTLDDITMDTKIKDAVKALPESHAVEWLSSILGGSLTSPYGYRTHPITGVYSLHGGVDIGANGGTPIYSTVDGFCIKNVYDSSYGNFCMIIATDGSCHIYAHMKSAAIPAVGDLVYAGMKIGYVGMTGSATGNHLHYEIRLDGTTSSRINPEDYTFPSPMAVTAVTA